MNQHDIKFVGTIKNMLERMEINLDSWDCSVLHNYTKEDNKMKSRPDIMLLLKDEKEHYLEQIRRINMAIAALGDDSQSKTNTMDKGSTPRRRIPWKKEIVQLFDEQPNEKFTPKKIRKILFEKGITEVDLPNNKNVVYNTLKRLEAIKYIEKVDFGLYQKKERELKHPTLI